MDIDSLIQNFKSYDELKVFCEAQFRQIQNLNVKNKELQEKLEAANKVKKEVTKTQFNNLPVSADFTIQDDAKTIAQIQLNMLKEISFDRELDTDEAKRVELYNRILKDDNSKKETLKATVEVIKDTDLLKLVE